MRMTGGDAILRCLEAEGVEVMFGIPGGAIMPTYDAMARGTTVRHVLARHEQGAGHMAQGYARASGRVAAGEALEDSLTLALRAPRRPSEVAGLGVAATTREFVDAVLGLLPSARRDTEFALGVSR